ncbi:MAG: monofunctional biosynthetic peptidoglycan transglycosylase [Pseudomonadota bacterium]|nr:monofunctional biosynthetic peptidoglycan transglycosylase [Pseudomonadota bacterium]
MRMVRRQKPALGQRLEGDATSGENTLVRLALGAAVLAAVPFLLALYYAVLPPPVCALMLWRLAQGNGIDYRWRSLEDIAPALPQAVITAEDAQFCRHLGIDWLAVQSSVENAFDEDEQPIRGASTISMQTAKNLYLWEGRSVLRKLIEAPLALWIESVWTKRRTIEIYLNIAEWGPGIYGAEAAARRHFGKPAARLSRQEAALLAAVLPNPIKRSAGKASKATRRKAAVVAQRMDTMGSYFNCLEN